MGWPVCPQCRQPEHVIGASVKGTYDGVLFWLCTVCDVAFPRNFMGQRLTYTSEAHAAQYNDNNPGVPHD